MQKSFGKLPSGTRLARIEQSANYRQGSFQNLEETKMMADGTSYIRLMSKFLSTGIGRAPVDPLPSKKVDLEKLPEVGPVIVWFGHSSYLLRLAGKTIVVDPVFSDRPSPIQSIGMKGYPVTRPYTPEDLPEIDVLILTHDHYDHLDYNTILKLKSKARAIRTALGVGAHLAYWGFDESRIKEFDWWESEMLFPGMELIATPGRHFSGRGLTRNKSLWSSFIVKTDTYRIFIGGDSGYDPNFKNIGQKYGPFDLAILECGQYNVMWPSIHMMPEESVQASIDLGARVMLPVHWGKFTLALHPWKEPIERATRHAKTLSVIHPISETRLISYANGDHPGDIRIRSRFSKLELSFVRPI